VENPKFFCFPTFCMSSWSS